MKSGGRIDTIAMLALGIMLGWCFCYGSYHVKTMTAKEHVLEFANGQWAKYSGDLEKLCAPQ